MFATQLAWIDRDGREESLGLPPRAYFSVRLDSTSRLVALEVRDQGDEGSDIWVLPLGRQTPTRVTFDPADDSLPAWTPDGRLVYSSTRDKALSLFAQPADGTGTAVELASSDGGLDQAAVSPDGKFVVARSNEDIVIAPMDGKTVRPLIESPFRDRNPDVSRDGRWIAYQSDESGVAEVYVRPFPDTDKGKWQVSEQGGSRPVWARSGTELFYLGVDGMVMSVGFSVSGNAFVPSAPRPVVRLPQAPGAHRAFDVSGDGRRFLTISGQTTTERAEINVVLNWPEELKKKVPVD